MTGREGHAKSEPVSVFRDRSISFVELPSLDIEQSARFYAEVFGWSVSGEGNNRGFTDGSGHVIGHWRADVAVAGESGARPYVYVDGVDEALQRVAAAGGRQVRAPWAEGDLRVALFSDPSGNVLGVWERPQPQ